MKGYRPICLLKKLARMTREGRRGDGHIGQGWVLRFKAINHINSAPHLESNADLQHHIQKRYTYAIDSDVNIYRQVEHKQNCFGNITKPKP
ncbi:hypothetical protein OUZ56_010349 [Daphnia magna]|uniref:HTH CENPB-type domain-containing protein n=1 Tax=Daphnia magna TaxID=35525 RepID=A0ABR0AID1_9CRUS|nr:hypothetical protein OUZ56_010349 [Daphnia magna]